MIQDSKNQEQLSDKVFVLTGAELNAFLQMQSQSDKNEVSDEQVSQKYSGVPQFVTGLKSLASTLNVSVSTIGRWKRKGLLDNATFQDGKTVIFDVHEVLDILRVSNNQLKLKNHAKRQN